MNSWKLAPFVRFTIPLVLGIVLESYAYFIDYQLFLLGSLIVFFVFLISWKLNSVKHRPAFPMLIGLFSAIFLFMLGIIFAYFNDLSKSPGFIGNYYEYKAYVGVVDSEVHYSVKSSKCIVCVQKVKEGNRWKSCTGKVMIYMDTSFQRLNKIKYGDQLLIYGKADTIQAPMNPGEFDYKRYLRYTNVFHRDYINSSNAVKTEEDKANELIGFAISARQACGNVMRKFVHAPREYAILSALVLGIRGELDDETIQAYSSAGAMHVLSVSGLHVALVFQLLTWVFGFLRHGKTGEWVYYFLSLFLIWGYAFLTGLCPSVMRSVVMFTIILLGQAANRSSNIFNSIACSAFLLLIYDPMLIMDVGFQLSYLAVLGIVYLQPKIYGWWEFKSVFGDWVWQITAVSLAAQIVTCPLGALYFHQFPTYFLVSNLIVIPASTIMLYGGIGLYFVSWIPYVANWTGYFLEKFTWAINELLVWNQCLPGSLIEGIYLDVWETWLIFGWLAAILLLFERKRIFYLGIAFLLTFIGSVHASIRWKNSRDQEYTFIYQVPKRTAIEWVSGNSSVLWTDLDKQGDKGKYRFHINNNHVKLGVREIAFIAMDSLEEKVLPVFKSTNYDLIVKNNLTLLIVKQYNPRLAELINCIKPDKVVFVRKGLYSIGSVGQKLPLSVGYIADGSNSMYSIVRAKRLTNQGIYFTSINGCYIENEIRK